MNVTTINIPFPDGSSEAVRRWEQSPLIFFKRGGTVYAQNGLPLSASIDECLRRGWVPCLDQARIDAVCGYIASGLDRGEAHQRAQKWIDEGKGDSMLWQARNTPKHSPSVTSDPDLVFASALMLEA